MINYLKQNHLSLLVALYLVIAGFSGDSSMLQNIPQDINEMLGAVTARTTITNPWTFNEAITTVATTTSSAGCFTNNSADICEVTYTLTDATTTLVNVQNPWWGTGTTTAVYAHLEITGAASTSQTFALGTTTASSASGNPLGCSTATVPAVCPGVLINAAVVATSSQATGLNGEGSLATIIGNGANLINTGLSTNWSAGTSIQMVIGPLENLTLVSTSTTPLSTTAPAFFNCETGSCADAGSDGITNTGNTFDGTLTVRYVKP